MDSGLFVGLHDRSAEGVWRFPSNSEYFDPNSNGSLFPWASGEPDNGDGYGESCVVVWHSTGFELNDYPCDYRFHGLCEVKVYDC